MKKLTFSNYVTFDYIFYILRLILSFFLEARLKSKNISQTFKAEMAAVNVVVGH